jgi:hypothetical protein
VDVERAAAHGIEERLRDLVAVRGPDQKLGPQREDPGHLLLVQSTRLPDRQTQGARGDLHRRLAQDATRGRAVGLRHNAHDLDDAALAKTIECLERANGELRSAKKERPLC